MFCGLPALAGLLLTFLFRWSSPGTCFLQPVYSPPHIPVGHRAFFAEPRTLRQLSYPQTPQTSWVQKPADHCSTPPPTPSSSSQIKPLLLPSPSFWSWWAVLWAEVFSSRWTPASSHPTVSRPSSSASFSRSVLPAPPFVLVL